MEVSIGLRRLLNIFEIQPVTTSATPIFRFKQLNLLPIIYMWTGVPRMVFA